MSPVPEAILFDLDGTLVDSAPDLLAALAHVRTGLGMPDADMTAYRHLVSRGAAGLLSAGLAGREGVDADAVHSDFLEHYRRHCWIRSRPFPGIEPLLAGLERAGIAWGIVTNKSEELARSVVAAAGWSRRCACLVGGDTAARAKPHPEPVRYALARLGLPAERTWFVGDDRRDVESGRAAGVTTLVAAWGYIPPGENIGTWGGDRIVDTPEDFASLLGVVTRRAPS